MTERSFTAQLDCHYLVQAPGVIDERVPLVVTLHGFSMNPEVMLGMTSRLFSKPPVIVSLQGPYQFFLDAKAQDVGYGWITNRHPAESIRLHHDMVSQALNLAGAEFDIPPERRLLCGFSQPVSLNYRFAATCPDAIRGVIGICGGVPSDWETGAYGRVSASVLHIARRQDSYYPPSLTERYPDRLRLRGAEVEYHLLDGGHQVPSRAQDIVDEWVRRVVR